MKKDAGPDRLISGRLRKKAARAGAAHRTVTVDGVEYAWSHRHGRRAWDRRVQELSISVALHPARTRELIVDFALALNAQGDTPSDLRVVAALEQVVRRAMAAGWDPESRGRAFRYEVPEPIA
jgi:hypothetical protein